MSNELTVRTESAGAMRPVEGFGEMTVQALVARKRKMQEVMQAVMKEGPQGHYGLIPGCGDKPSLFKSGAEVLATTFGLAPRFVVVQTDLPNGHREYRVTCTLTHIGTGANCGEGVGSCSTMEAKYRYRAGDSFEVTDQPIPRDAKDRKSEYRKQGFGMKKVDGSWVWVRYTTDGAKTENPDIADVYNTVLKMAKKRAQVDATLTATGASDIFTQDIEDMQRKDDEYSPPPPPAPTNGATPKPDAPSADRQALIKRILSGAQDGLPFKATAAAMGKGNVKGWSGWTDAELEECWQRMQPAEPATVPSSDDGIPF